MYTCNKSSSADNDVCVTLVFLICNEIKRSRSHERTNERTNLSRSGERANLTRTDERTNLTRTDERANLTRTDERANLTRTNERALSCSGKYTYKQTCMLIIFIWLTIMTELIGYKCLSAIVPSLHSTAILEASTHTHTTN